MACSAELATPKVHHLHAVRPVHEGHCPVHECNRLLRFCKDNKDVGLTYNYIGEPQDLRLITFFDAGFTARPDGNSQGGYITLLAQPEPSHLLRGRRVPRDRLEKLQDAKSGEKLTRRRSASRRTSRRLRRLHMSLLAAPPAESAAPGPHRGEVHPEARLGDRCQGPARFLPREGISSSVIDKRVSLKIKVMKERMECLGGSLRWMSSER